MTYRNDGRLSSLTDTGGTSSYTYDAEGNLLLQKEPGSTTLYLPGEQLTLANSVVTGVRYFALPGGGAAYRTGSGTNYGFQVANQQGTQTLRLDSTAQTPTWRQFTPYGASRGPAASWVDNRLFLDQPASVNSGLTLLGERAYDPTLGQFTSLDPLFDATDPQSFSGYAYTNGNPISHADASGRSYSFHDDSGAGGGGGAPDNCKGHRCEDNNSSSGSDPRGGGNTNNSTAPPAEQPQPEEESWWDEHKGAIAGIVVGAVTFMGCEAVTAGAGTVACAAAAGAVGNVVTYAVDTPRDQWTPDGFLTTAAEGFVVGAVGGVIGKALAPVAEAVGGAFARAVPTVIKDAAAEVSAGVQAVASKVTSAAKGALDSVVSAVKSVASTFNRAVKPGCFVAGTPILMADGTSKPIETVRPGDQVTAYNPATGTNETHVVARTFVRTDIPTYAVTLHDGDTITTTEEHPFWVEGRGWTPANALNPNDRLREPDGTTTTVQAVAPTGHVTTVYNFEVETLHDYYVRAGSAWVLVHNAGCGGAGKEIANYWPTNRGALGPSTREHLYAGMRVDRYGYPGGTFVSPAETPYTMRALPPGSSSKPFSTYEVVKPFEVLTSRIAPAFGELGLGLQHELPTSVANLLRLGILREVS